MLSRPIWSERTVATPRLQWHLRELTAAGPALLLLHGLGVDGSVWQAVGRRLSPTYTLVAADLRGHGQSDHPLSGYQASDYAADTAELLDVLANDYGAVHLLGHSLGALAALGAAALNPSAVQRLILEDPPLGGPGPIAPYLSAVLASKRLSHAALRETVLQFQPGIGTLVGEIQTAMWERTADAALQAILESPTTVFATDDWPDQVGATTLLLAADPALDARLTPVQAAATLRRLPHGQLVQFPGSGHVIHAQRAAEFCRVVLDFLQG